MKPVAADLNSEIVVSSRKGAARGLRGVSEWAGPMRDSGILGVELPFPQLRPSFGLLSGDSSSRRLQRLYGVFRIPFSLYAYPINRNCSRFDSYDPLCCWK